MNIKNDIYVAKLGKTVGLKGHLKLFIDSDFPQQFKKGARFITNKKLDLLISEYNSSKNLIKFEGYDNIDIAKKLTNQELYSNIEQTRQNCTLEKNEHFWFDLQDCKIYEDSIYLGLVEDILRYPLNDYLQIKTSEDLVSQNLPKSFLLPYIFDTYILDVNIQKKEIKVTKAYEILENS